MSTRSGERLRVREQFLTILRNREKIPDSMFDRANPKPLAIGIDKELKQEILLATTKEVQIFLIWWCNRKAYFRSVIAEDSVRHHLDGSTAAAITAEERDYAATRLAQRLEKDQRKTQARKLAKKSESKTSPAKKETSEKQTAKRGTINNHPPKTNPATKQ